MNEEYFVDSEEEIREREQAEEVRRLVHAEVHRIHTGEVKVEAPSDAEPQETPRPLPNWLRWIGRSLTGDILVTAQVQRAYNLLTILGIIFFLAIFAIFASFRQELRYATLQKEVKLWRERAIFSTEQRHNESSHSAILRRLQEMNVELEDPQNQPKILR